MTGCFVGLFRTLVRVGSIPERLRPVIRAALDALVAGGEPELLTWVKGLIADPVGVARRAGEAGSAVV